MTVLTSCAAGDGQAANRAQTGQRLATKAETLNIQQV